MRKFGARTCQITRQVNHYVVEFYISCFPTQFFTGMLLVHFYVQSKYTVCSQNGNVFNSNDLGMHFEYINVYVCNNLCMELSQAFEFCS